MWIYVKEQLVNLDYVTWITKHKGKKDYGICLSHQGDDKPIIIDFPLEIERDDVFQELTEALINITPDMLDVIEDVMEDKV